MARKIPPLNPLRVFEVVARTENLTRAAEELHVSQPAVSRQLGVLESYVGVELFRRERHGIRLTRAGQKYAQAVMPAFEAIGAATDQLMKRGRENTLHVQTYTTFAAKWLIPRLADFRALQPEIAVVITNSVEVPDFDRDDVDLSIQIGTGHWPRIEADFLFDDIIEPVCSPAFLRQHAPDARYPQALLRTRLLVSHYRQTDWDQWAKACDYGHEIAGTERMRFSSSVLTWQAAADGLGIAIGQTALLGEDFAQQRLVAPFGLPVRAALPYYLLRPQLQRPSRRVTVFRDWLLTQCGQVGQPVYTP